MQSFGTEDLSELSPEAQGELVTDHDLDEDCGPLVFGEPSPSVAKKTALGEQVVAVGMALLNKPVREDAGTNADKDGVIRSCFLEGIPWPARYWDAWQERYRENFHRESPVPRPEWCAAFACYCVRKGYAAAGLAGKLPKVFRSSTSDLRSLFRSMGRFIERNDLFDALGQIKPGAPMPGPGDIVLWQGHTGLLYDLHEDGSYRTLEGNTRPKKDATPGVYLLSNSSSRKIEKDGKQVYSLTGFCRLASLDG